MATAISLTGSLAVAIAVAACANDHDPSAAVRTVTPLTIGAPCDDDDDCPEGRCVDTADGDVCLASCVDVCASGYECVELKSSDGPDGEWVCMPLADGPAPDVSEGDAPDPDDAQPDDAVPDGAETDDAPPAADTGHEGAGAAGASPPPVAEPACAWLRLVVTNAGVTSASVWVDGAALVTPADFPTSAALERTIALHDGANERVVSARLAGSPGDRLSLAVVDAAGAALLERALVREHGAPVTTADTLAVEVDCD